MERMMAPSTQPVQKRAQIPQAMDELFESLDGIKKITQLLEEKLQPILRSPEPQDECEKQGRAPVVELATHISSATEAQHVICEKLSDILQRIEL